MLEKKVAQSQTLQPKLRLADLAILGGPPAFNEKQHVGRPNIGSKEKLLERIGDLIDRRWLSNDGPLVREFEARIADLANVKHCISMCNATVALEITAKALGLQGEVIVPSFTFVATAHALQWQEITPVFCDIDSLTHSIDPAQIERLITPKTSGIIGVHLWGSPCDISALEEIAGRHKLKLMFDAAHALGSSYNGRPIGGFGDAEVFSFHATKFINAFEGGAVVTNDDDLARRIRLMRNFGFSDYDCVTFVGTNGKMSEASAAMGLCSLESIDYFIEINKRNYLAYANELGSIPGIRLYKNDPRHDSNYQYVILEIESNDFGLTRDQLVEILHAENVLARRYFHPGCHKMEPYRSYFPNAGLLLPRTERLTELVVALPTGTATSTEDINRICQVIKFASQNSVEFLGEYERSQTRNFA